MRFKYDASSKWLIETFAPELLRIAGVGPIVSVKPLPGELVQSRQLPDGLVEVTFSDRSEPVLHLIEVNTYSYASTASELLDDVLLTYLNRRVVPEVIAITLHDRGNVRVAPEIRVRSPSGYTRLEAGWRVVNLWELNAVDFLPLTDPGLAPWVTLMKIDGPPEPVLQQCRDVIETLPAPGRRANLLGVTQILAGLRFDEGMLEKLFRVEGKMIESPVLEKWFRQREIAAYHRAILEGLEVRFGTVPEDVSAAVRVVTDEMSVGEIRKASYVCTSLDDFRARLAQSLPRQTSANAN
ncbi:hypothetical protein VT84_01230 [Gemmata sp. SH-PL17]|uniref:hypothetical protein n=1 Tax=Gemmata sp. SH-PL17 TaxID=1630693 RepID=UPI00078D3302|nr:hypothetical protein [Gemmata sp. SH-PL17]AMV23002.1 hypothetical protein VT84_01230 [Gemmata sp. SH-PL17]